MALNVDISTPVTPPVMEPMVPMTINVANKNSFLPVLFTFLGILILAIAFYEILKKS